jgi:hypothetical protein
MQHSNIDVARCPLCCGPTVTALETLCRAGEVALPFFADCIMARLPLSGEEWALLPSPCPGLALPAVLAHSSTQATRLVQHLPPAHGCTVPGVGPAAFELASPHCVAAAGPV